MAIPIEADVVGKVLRSIDLKEKSLLKKPVVVLAFEDGSRLELRDVKQRCCERRYWRSDDDATDFVGAVVRDIELGDAYSEDVNSDRRDVQFIRVITSRGTFVVCAHNDHNGYYSGFDIVAEFHAAPVGKATVSPETLPRRGIKLGEVP